MHFHESITIEARPERVWEYLGAPERWNLFHVKAGRCAPAGVEGARIGSLYAMEFRLGMRTTPTRSEVVDLRPGRLIQVKSTAATPGQPDCSAVITYELEDLGASTRVTERIEVEGARINFFFRAVIWFVSRFGRPQGETTLMKLKRIVEAG